MYRNQGISGVFFYSRYRTFFTIPIVLMKALTYTGVGKK